LAQKYSADSEENTMPPISLPDPDKGFKVKDNRSKRGAEAAKTTQLLQVE